MLLARHHTTLSEYGSVVENAEICIAAAEVLR